MSIQKLRKLLPVPKNPVDVPNDHDWLRIEVALGIALPVDYKQFISDYGVGCIDGFIWVYSPITTNRHLNLIDRLLQNLEMLTYLKDSGDIIPYDLRADGDRLISWGGTDNGDILYWLFGSEDYRIVIQEGRGSEWNQFRLSTTEFLARLLRRDIMVDVFPDDFLKDPHIFTPWSGN